MIGVSQYFHRIGQIGLQQRRTVIERAAANGFQTVVKVHVPQRSAALERVAAHGFQALREGDFAYSAAFPERIFANFGHRVRNVDFFQRRRAAENIRSDGGQPLREGNVFEVGALIEGSLFAVAIICRTDRFQILWIMEAGQRSAALEHAVFMIGVSQHLHRIRQVGLQQRRTVIERAAADGFQAVIKDDVREGDTALEGVAAYRFQPLRETHDGQLGIVLKSAGPDGGHPMRFIGHFRDDHGISFAVPAGDGGLGSAGEGEGELLCGCGERIIGNAVFPAEGFALCARIAPGRQALATQESVRRDIGKRFRQIDPFETALRKCLAADGKQALGQLGLVQRRIAHEGLGLDGCDPGGRHERVRHGAGERQGKNGGA